MHAQVLSSGSGGNSCLVRAGDLRILVDAGLPPRAMRERLDAARLPPAGGGIDHVLVTHAHLDHARSAGVIARRSDATVHCAERMIRNRSVARAPRFSVLPIGGRRELAGPGEDRLVYEPVLLPHDCDPTVAFRLTHPGPEGDRTLVVLTDMGEPREEVARALQGAHVLVLEFNHDPELLRAGPYPASLQRRVGGNLGHLSNEEGARMLARLAGPELHTLVLAHLSEKNNTPELALAAARTTLESMGLGHVEVLVASQHEVGPNLRV